MRIGSTVERHDHHSRVTAHARRVLGDGLGRKIVIEESGVHDLRLNHRATPVNPAGSKAVSHSITPTAAGPPREALNQAAERLRALPRGRSTSPAQVPARSEAN